MRMLALLALLLPSTCGAFEFESDAFTPYRIKIALGTSMEDTLEIMKDQGFTFIDATDDESNGVLLIKVDGYQLIDHILVVVPRTGSLDFWNSSKVLLGFRNGLLSLIKERVDLPDYDARRAFKETMREYREIYPDSTNRKSGGSGLDFGLPPDEYAYLFGGRWYDDWYAFYGRRVVSVLGVQRRVGVEVTHFRICSHPFLVKQMRAKCPE